MSPRTPFGKAVARILLDRDMTAAEAARRVGVSPTFLTAVTRGRKGVPADFAERLSVSLGLSAPEADALRAAAEEGREAEAVEWLRARGWTVTRDMAGEGR